MANQNPNWVQRSEKEVLSRVFDEGYQALRVITATSTSTSTTTTTTKTTSTTTT